MNYITVFHLYLESSFTEYFINAMLINLEIDSKSTFVQLLLELLRVSSQRKTNATAPSKYSSKHALFLSKHVLEIIINQYAIQTCKCTRK